MSEWNAAVRRWQVPAIRLSRVTSIQIAASVAFSVVTLLMLDFGNDILLRISYEPNGIRIYFPLAAALVVAAVFVRARYDEFTPLLKACLRASALGLVTLLVLEAPD